MSEEQQSQFSASPHQRNENRKISQEELERLLQITITQLNTILKQLETNALDNLPNRESVDQLVKSTEAITVSLQTLPFQPTQSNATLTSPPQTQPDEEWEETPELDETEDVSGVDRLFPSFNRVQRFWDSLLTGIRGVLPNALSEKLSDWAITSIIAVIIVGVLSTSVFLFPQPFSIPEIVQIPSDVPSANPKETPSQLDSPENAEPITISPSPQPQLTPEQSLIASIQQEVTDLTNQYPMGLIGTIEANFLGSRLIVTMGDQWYELSKQRQDKLASSIFERAQKLDFKKLELIDSQGTLIARSPVVGEQIIILQRQLPLS